MSNETFHQNSCHTQCILKIILMIAFFVIAKLSSVALPYNLKWLKDIVPWVPYCGVRSTIVWFNESSRFTCLSARSLDNSDQWIKNPMNELIDPLRLRCLLFILSTPPSTSARHYLSGLYQRVSWVKLNLKMVPSCTLTSD